MKDDSAKETIMLASCSSVLIISALGLSYSPDPVNYILPGYGILDGILYLLDGTTNLNVSKKAGIWGGLAQYLMGITGICISGSQDTTAICSWLAACACIETFVNLGVALNSSEDDRALPAETHLKDFCLAVGWFILACYGLTNLTGCIFLCVALAASARETHLLSRYGNQYSLHPNYRKAPEDHPVQQQEGVLRHIPDARIS